MTKHELEFLLNAQNTLDRIAAACERTAALLEEIRDRGKSGKPAAAPVEESTRQSGGLLKGSHLADAGLEWIVVHVTSARKAPETFRSPWILDIQPVLGQNSFPVNVSNAKILLGELHTPVEQTAGRELILATVNVNNPETGAATVGLQVCGVFGLVRGLPDRVRLTPRAARLRPHMAGESLPWEGIG